MVSIGDEPFHCLEHAVLEGVAVLILLVERLVTPSHGYHLLFDDLFQYLVGSLLVWIAFHKLVIFVFSHHPGEVDELCLLLIGRSIPSLEPMFVELFHDFVQWVFLTIVSSCVHHFRSQWVYGAFVRIQLDMLVQCRAACAVGIEVDTVE